MNADGDALEARHVSSASCCSDCSCRAPPRYGSSREVESRVAELRGRVAEVEKAAGVALDQNRKVANVNLIR